MAKVMAQVGPVVGTEIGPGISGGIFPESDERRVLVVFVFRRGRDVRPGENRSAADPLPPHGKMAPLSAFWLFLS